MYPHERSLVEQLKGQPFALIGVNSDGDIDKLKEIIKEKNLTWRSFRNDEGVDGKISEMWGIRGWPTVFIIDAEGVIRWTGHGANDKMIEKCLAEIGHEVEITHEDEEDDDDDDKKDDEEKKDKKDADK